MAARVEQRNGVYADGRLDGRRFAELLGIPHGTVKRWLMGGLPCIRQGHHVRIDPEAAKQWIAKTYPDSVAFRRAATVVYFVRRDRDGSIKIGFSSDLERRLRELRRDTGCDVMVLACIPGSKPLELALHGRFAEDILEEEWFRPSERLLAFIASLGRSAA